MGNASSIKPRRFRQGQRIGIIAPSFPLAAVYRERFEAGVRALAETFDATVHIGAHVDSHNDYVGATPQHRADDLNEMIRDNAIAAIFTTIGGFNSNQLLPFIDFDAAKTRCKIFVGYSDTTALLAALNGVSNWTCFYGPAVLPQFGEYPSILEYTRANVVRALCRTGPLGSLVDPEYTIVEASDWSGNEWKSRSRRREGFGGRKVIREGTGAGVVFGGNIETLNFLIGTKWWNPPADVIFFFEATAEEAYLPRVERSLTQLRQIGFLDRVRGVLVGYRDCYQACEGAHIETVLLRQFGDYEFPIVINLPFGHIDPIMTIPIGVEAKVVAWLTEAKIEFTESAVID
jgi:muramoyltetrapeptide carboxypeptidase